jgi:hypothetical protein
MISKDYIERELAKLILAIQRLMQVVLVLKESDRLEEASIVIDEGIISLFSISKDDLLTFNPDEFYARINNYESEHLNELGNLLFELAQVEYLNGNVQEAIILRDRVKATFHLAEVKSKSLHLGALSKLDQMNKW